MKPDGKANRRWWLWLPLLAVAGWLALFGDTSPASDAAAVSLPTRTAPAQANASLPSLAQAAPAENTLVALLPRAQLIPAPAAGAASAASRDLFSTRNWTPPPAPAASSAPPAPVAPPLPYVFVGKKQEADTWEVYLTRGELTFVARQGETLEGTYRVDAIQPPTLSLTYLPIGQVQTIAIGESR